MQKMIIWASQNKDKITSYIQNKEYTKLLNDYHVATGYSINRAAAVFKCSRRALLRYLSGERMVPMNIVNIMLKEMNFSDTDIKMNVSDDIVANTTNKEKDAEIVSADDSSAFVWYGHENKIMFNDLYAYRTLKFHQSLFEAACTLNINETLLSEYENGKRRITYTDIQKILNGYNLKIEGLFPSLVSYDGRKTFLPLKPVMVLKIEGNEYDLVNGDLYIASDEDIINEWPTFPVQRYDDTGKPLLKYMPDELTIDEYINSSELMFLKDDLRNYYTKNIDGLKLPPNYRPLFGLAKKKSESAKYIGYKRIVTNMELYPNEYSVSFRSGTRRISFDLSSYVFSDSPWYAMLHDKEYFMQGKLCFVGNQIPQNQCIVWPDRQYIRIIELYLEKKPYGYFAYPAAYGCCGPYDNWTLYET